MAVRDGLESGAVPVSSRTCPSALALEFGFQFVFLTAGHAPGFSCAAHLSKKNSRIRGHIVHHFRLLTAGKI
jgi:hypothetical protein